MDTQNTQHLEIFYEYVQQPQSIKLALQPDFRTAIMANTPFIVQGETLWAPGAPLPNPGSAYMGTPITDYSELFATPLDGISSVEVLDLSLWDVSNATNMAYMFSGNSLLNEVKVSSWDTQSLERAGSMFYYCYSLTALDVSMWDTRHLNHAAFMFSHCTSLAYLDVSRWDTQSLTDAGGLFTHCVSLTSLDVSGWKTDVLYDAWSMFANCSQLQSLNLAKWSLGSISYMAGIFFQCGSLETLALPHVEDNNGVSMDLERAFYGCKRLKTIDLTALNPTTNPFWTAAYGYDDASTFSGCTRLESVVLPKRIASQDNSGIPTWTEIIVS